jgi:hypothetical protein
LQLLGIPTISEKLIGISQQHKYWGCASMY